ncbi:FecR family protein [Steroidobacter sp.]|uniref:FecR family protein n=1 Tax=Steroidobacter sp. TaxID=1978227 RepID=UPI001A3C220A|nr:FecR domain-containing protein [Steroidobacter sp.]MBL8268965.1 FecR domain-containing protein [Steroidobacter sp.]
MESRQQAEAMASRLIAQRETGPWTAEDAAMLAAWLAESPGHRAAYYRFHAAWKEAGRLTILVPPAVNATPAPPALRVVQATRGPSRSTLFRYALAASAVLAIGVSSFYLFKPADNEFRTAVGGLATVPVADGSRITLNTDSRIRVDISGAERRVQLEKGEAYFEVAKDPNRPFVVVAGNHSVTAVGTAFSVRREGDDVRVNVTEGTVKVAASLEKTRAPNRPGASGEGLLLTAGSIAESKNDAVLVQNTGIAEVEQGLTWRSGTLTFRQTPLADAIAEFNRYNGRQIIIEDSALARIEVGGVFRATGIDPFIYLLQSRFRVSVTEDGDRIVLHARQ